MGRGALLSAYDHTQFRSPSKTSLENRKRLVQLYAYRGTPSTPKIGEERSCCHAWKWLGVHMVLFMLTANITCLHVERILRILRATSLILHTFSSFTKCRRTCQEVRLKLDTCVRRTLTRIFSPPLQLLSTLASSSELRLSATAYRCACWSPITLSLSLFLSILIVCIFLLRW